MNEWLQKTEILPVTHKSTDTQYIQYIHNVLGMHRNDEDGIFPNINSPWQTNYKKVMVKIHSSTPSLVCLQDKLWFCKPALLWFNISLK